MKRTRKTESTRFDLYQTVTDSIIKALEAGVTPWRRPWGKSQQPPRNGATHRHYRGINLLLLSLSPYSDPRWYTFNQAKALGGFIKEGEKSTLVVFWKMLQVVDETTGLPIEIPYLQFYRVFNFAQCGGIDDSMSLPDMDDGHDVPAIREADQILAHMPSAPKVKHGFDSACYAPKADEVRMPRREAFSTTSGYYGTLFHELAHSTGHESRLNRFKTEGSHAFGSADYSREELVAEIASSFVMASAGLDYDLPNTAAYLDSWIRALKGDPKLIVQASSKAQAAADWILGTTPN